MEETGLNRLGEKSAVVRGAAKGIGRTTAELFARERSQFVQDVVIFLAVLVDALNRRREGRAG